MKVQNTARAYANALMSLATAEKINIADEMTKLNEVINQSNDLENVLFLELFTIEEKASVVADILKKGSYSKLIKDFMNFLLSEKRITLLPLVYKELVVIDDHNKGFMRGTIEGREDHVDSTFEKKIGDYLKSKLGRETELSYSKNEKITAGYRVTVEDLQLDASLDNQLEKFKKSVLNG